MDMEEEAIRGLIARVLLRNFGAHDAQPVQSDHDARSETRSETQDRLLVHRQESPFS
uniref:Uncharacterized protein n=1 Tax=Fagus sylvatica TaxID=28930 RepID=A0A2N9FU88_FAGSY